MTQALWGRLGPRLIPLLAAFLALLVGAVSIVLLGADPILAYRGMLEGAFGSPNAIADSLVKAGPLLFVGVGICIAYRGGMINIGGEGQYVMGALFATIVTLNLRFLPGILIITLALIASLIGGGLWASIAGLLKVRFRVNEVLSTVMLNFIAIQIMGFLLRGPLMDLSQKDLIRYPQTERFVRAADLPRLIPTRLHLGILLGVLIAVLVYILLWRTTIGYRIRAVGLNPLASRYAGIRVASYNVLAIALSGALAGLGGAVEILGVEHRLFTDGSLTGFTGNAGFNGIVTALFGGLHPLGTIPASFLFGALLVGANSLQRTVQIPAASVTTLDGLVVLFVVASQAYARRQSTRRAAVPAAREAPEKGALQTDAAT